MPVEVILEIFESAASSDSSRDLYALATSSKHLYRVFKEHEFAIFRRSIMHLLRLDTHPDDIAEPVMDYFIKLGMLRSIKPWPTDIVAIQRALRQIAESDRPTKSTFQPSECGGILAWIRESATHHPHWRVHDNELPITNNHLQRSRYARNHGLTQPRPGDDQIKHPFDRIYPLGIQRSEPDEDGRLVYWCYQFYRAMEDYKRHADVPVSRKEKALVRTANYVPCCTLERCPRFFNSTTAGTQS